MKQSADVFTPDLLGPPRRGRPRKPDALTPAERARRYRARKRAAADLAGREPFEVEGCDDEDLSDERVSMMNPDELRAITGNTIDCCKAWIAEARAGWRKRQA